MDQMHMLYDMMELIMRGQSMPTNIDKSVNNFTSKVGIFDGRNLTRFLIFFDEEMLKCGIVRIDAI